MCSGFGTFGFKSRRLPTPCRRRQRFSPERETSGLRNSRTTASKSSSGSSRVSAARPRPRLLHRRQRRLQLVRRMAPVVHAVPLAPLPDGLLADAIPFGQNPGRLRARLDRRPHLRRRRGLLVKRDQYPRPPFRTARRIDLAMKRKERRGSMRSSGTGHKLPIA